MNKSAYIERWRETRDYQDRGVTFTFKADDGTIQTGTGAISRGADETVLALAGLLIDYTHTIEVEIADFTKTKPYKTREFVVTTGPFAARYQILRVKPDDLGALYEIDLGAVLK